MRKIKVNNFKIRDIKPFEHIEFIVKNTTPSQRLKWLEQAWNLWYHLRKKVLPKSVAELQDKFREGKI